jgi:RNA polymerase sigma-70 factor, ECF subfamily
MRDPDPRLSSVVSPSGSTERVTTSNDIALPCIEMEEDVERGIREAHARSDFATAVREALELYEAEVFSFLCARLGGESDANDVYSQTCEDLWRGIAGFAWRSSFRTWFYTVARHAAIRFERAPANQEGRRQSLSRVSDPAVADRSRTRPYLRTDVKDRFAALRSSLTPDEQSLLVLRIDRDLSWEEIAGILRDEGDEADDAGLKREASNLRQRFRKLKERLRQRARAVGLLDDDP